MGGGGGGGPARVGVSAALTATVVASVTLVLGLVEAFGPRIDDWHVAVAIPVGAAFWLLGLYLIWATFGQWRRLLRTIFLCLAISAVTIGLCVLVGSTMRRGEVLVTGMAILGVAAVLAAIVSASYQASRGRALRDADGSVSVLCPKCGYNLVGLDSCKCPECGHHPTVDGLIAAQDYEGVRDILLEQRRLARDNGPPGLLELPRLPTFESKMVGPSSPPPPALPQSA